MSRRRTAAEAIFVIALVPILAGVLASLSWGPLPEHRPLAQVWLAIAGAGWLAAVAVAGRVPDSRPLVVALVAGALALRLGVLVRDPGLSDDVHRYVWEGGLVAEGISPYAFAPDDPRLAPLRERWTDVHAAMNHPDVSAAYPPLTQLVHAAIVAAAGGPSEAGRARLALRVAFAACDLLVLAALLPHLRARGRPRAAAVVWAWCPLVALEYAGSAHFDSLGILLLVAGLALVDAAAARTAGAASRPDRIESRTSGGLVLLTLGALVKLLPAGVLPFALRAAPAPWRGVGLVGALVLLGVAPLVLLEGGLSGLSGGLSEYALRWESFNLLFRWIEAPIDLVLARDGGPMDARRVARGIALLIWIGVGVGLWRARADALRAAAVLVATFLLLTPVVHPWYLTWIAPFLAFRASPGWALLVAGAPLCYWPLTEWRARGEWIEPAWLWPAVALPVLALLALEAVRGALRRRANG